MAPRKPPESIQIHARTDITGKVAELRARRVDGVEVVFEIYVGGELLATFSKPKKLADWALWEQGAASVRHEYDLREAEDL